MNKKKIQVKKKKKKRKKKALRQNSTLSPVHLFAIREGEIRFSKLLWGQGWAKFELVLVLTLENACSWTFHFKAN